VTDDVFEDEFDAEEPVTSVLMFLAEFGFTRTRGEQRTVTNFLLRLDPPALPAPDGSET
jgi:hypothetical protein